MGLFRRRPSPAQLALSALQAENSDLRAQLRREREQFEAERRELIDRLLALTNPPALREVRRQPQEGLLLSSPRKQRQSTLPPYPERAPKPPVNG